MIPLPEKFKQYIGSNITSYFRFIELDNVFISENKMMISGEWYEDRGLKISSIKQSVNLKTGTFKISNVNVTISNFVIDGKRFSDLFNDKSLINSTATIYLSSNPNLEKEDCLQLFQGKVRRYSMDSKKVNILIEDASQEKMHKDLPLARVIDSEKILEQYRNTHIPMVFGYNDKSPLYYYKEDIASNEFQLLPDNIALPRTEENSYTWGGRIPLIGGFKTDLDYGEEPVRAFKGDWIEIPSQRTMVPNQYTQYEIDVDKVKITKDTSPLENIEQRFIDEQLTEQEYECVKFENMSPIANNIFEGYTILRPESFTLLDQFLAKDNYPDTVEYDTFYMGKTGVNNNTEKVDVEKISEDKIEFTFPKQQENVEGYRTGFRFGYWRKQSSNTNYYFDWDWSEPEYGYPSSLFGSAWNLWQIVQNGSSFSQHPGGWWLTGLPSPLQIHEYLFTHMPAMGYELNSENGVNGANPTGAENYGPPNNYARWRNYRAPQNTDEFITNWQEITGHSCGAYTEFDYGVYVNGIGNLLSLNLRGNQKFCEWWFGVDENGNLGAPTDSFGRGVGPFMKNYDIVSDYEVGQNTMTWEQESFPAGSTQSKFVTFSRKEAILESSDYQRLDNVFMIGTSKDMRYGWATDTGGPLPVCWFNPYDLSFHTAGEHANGFSATDGEPYKRMSKTGFTLISPGYDVVDDPNNVVIKTQGNVLQALRLVFNFPDLETNDIVDPFYKKNQETGDDYLAIQTYKPSFYTEFNINLKSDIRASEFVPNQPEIDGLDIVVDNLPPILDSAPVPPTGFDGNYSNSNTEYYLTPGIDQHESADFDKEVWTGPNDFNDIGVTIRPQLLPLEHREYSINGYVTNPQIRHTCNYDKLDKTRFYGRVNGRKYSFGLHPELRTSDSDYTITPGQAVNLRNASSDFWNIYPLYSATFSPTYSIIDQATFNENTELVFELFDNQTDKVSMFDYFYSGVVQLNQLYGPDGWTLFGYDGGPSGSTLLGLITGWIENFINSDGDNPVDKIKDYVISESWNGDVPDYERLSIVYNYMIEAFSNTLVSQNTLLENPVDIIGSLLYTDLNFTGNIDLDSFLEARNLHAGYKFAFTVHDVINSKELIEKIATNTRIYPKLRPSDGSLSFVSIKPNYLPENVNEIIEASDVLRYSFNLTKIDDVKNRVRVVYKPDPGHKNYEKATDYVLASDLLPEYENDYYGLETESEDTTLDFESDYIRDEQTAIQLRNYLCLSKCNQRLKAKIDLSLKYSHLETGDVVYIDKLIEDFKAYGKDYTTYNYINGQIIFPYFIVEDVRITLKGVSLTLMQLAFTGEGQLGFESYLESLGFSQDDIEDLIPDTQATADNVVYGCTYSNATNYNPEATVDDGTCEFSQNDYSAGDVNGDGQLNVQDLVIIVNQIIGGE